MYPPLCPESFRMGFHFSIQSEVTTKHYHCKEVAESRAMLLNPKPFMDITCKGGSQRETWQSMLLCWGGKHILKLQYCGGNWTPMLSNLSFGKYKIPSGPNSKKFLSFLMVSLWVFTFGSLKALTYGSSKNIFEYLNVVSCTYTY
jgi:hypothetical protein